jgi:predicted transcriptional regulator
LNPEFVLDKILQRYFVVKKGDRKKKLKYGKLKHSPDLIEKLDLKKLRNSFEDVESLIQKINKLSI